MSLNSRQQTPRNVIGARDQFAKAGASGVDLVVHYADALRDDDGSRIARERFERQPHHAASTPSSNSYLETLELVNKAARAMATMEDHSQRIQAKAYELTQRARADRVEASQYISFLEEQLAASEARSLELSQQLDEAEPAPEPRMNGWAASSKPSARYSLPQRPRRSRRRRAPDRPNARADSSIRSVSAG